MNGHERIGVRIAIAGIAKDIFIAALHVEDKPLIKKGFTTIAQDIKDFVNKEEDQHE